MSNRSEKADGPRSPVEQTGLLYRKIFAILRADDQEARGAEICRRENVSEFSPLADDLAMIRSRLPRPGDEEWGWLIATIRRWLGFEQHHYPVSPKDEILAGACYLIRRDCLFSTRAVGRTSPPSVSTQEPKRVVPVPAVLSLIILKKHFPDNLSVNDNVQRDDVLRLLGLSIRYSGFSAKSMLDRERDLSFLPIEDASGEAFIYLRFETADGEAIIDVSPKSTMEKTLRKFGADIFCLTQIGRIEGLDHLRNFKS